MKKIEKYSFLQFIFDIWTYVKPYKGKFYLGVFIRLLSDLSRLYPALALSRIIVILSKPLNSDSISEVVIISITFGLLTIFYSITHSLSKYFGYQVAEKASLDLYNESLAHIFKLDFAWQEKENSGNKLRRIDRGLDGVKMAVRRIFDVLIEVIVNTFGIVIIFNTLEKKLSYSIIFFIITYFIIGTKLLKRAVRQERIVNKSYENLGGITFESLNNIQTIKSLAIDKGMLHLVERIITNLIGKIRRRIYFFQSRNAILDTYEGLFEYSVIVFIVFGIIQGKYDLGLLTLFLGLFHRVGTSARELTDVTEQISLAKIWISRTMSILKTEPVIENPDIVKNQLKYPSDWEIMKIQNINFSYKKNTALKNVSFKVNRGEKVGIVGLSGAGKSTLFKLILDLYEDYEGDIYFNDISLKNMQRQSYIDHVSVVLQDTELFDMSLKHNIEIASVHKSDDPSLLNNVIKMAHLEDVVEKLPDGVNTIVGEKGIKLSGGQRQRVGIARALYRQPDLLLLDEATSHLDAHSEKEIQKALKNLMHKFTIIVIAHRLSTIKAMDKIVVLENGGVVEQGSFEELLNANGAFARMWKEQKI